MSSPTPILTKNSSPSPPSSLIAFPTALLTPPSSLPQSLTLTLTSSTPSLPAASASSQSNFLVSVRFRGPFPRIRQISLPHCQSPSHQKCRYAMDVNVERAEDVLTHKRLLQLAHDPANRPAVDIRLVQVGQFKYILGAKPTHESLKKTIHTITHPKDLKLPTSLIPGRCGLSVPQLVESLIRVTVVLVGHLAYSNHCLKALEEERAVKEAVQADVRQKEEEARWEIEEQLSSIVYLVLKFVVQLVDGQISFLEAKEAALVINFCMCLLKLYSDLNIGKISLSQSSTLVNEEKAEKYKDLRALLQLLSTLCSKDLVDFSTDPIESQGISIAQVVYTGLHIITPLVSLDLLKFPKLCHDYFSLLSHILEVYPEMIAQLSGESFAHIMGTLDFGLRFQDSDVVDMCLRATKALASHHYKEAAIGGTGLGSHATGFMDANGKQHEGFLGHSLPYLLQFLLFDDYSSNIVSAAADALLPLILCEQALFQKLGNELIERQTDPGLKSRLANSLHLLSSANQLTSSLDRINYQRFRKNLRNFLIDVRGFLKTV